jgi:cobalt-zinc-cadmium efflux system outer membrane protein
MHFFKPSPLPARFFAAFVSYVTATLPLCAAEPESAPPLTVTALVEEALAKHPELRFYEAEIVAAKAGRRVAGKLANPELTGTVGQNRVRDAAGNLSGEGVAWSVGLMQQFEWPGRIGLRKAIANQNITLAELGLARFKTALAGRVRTLAYSLGAAQEQAEASREVAERLRGLREILVQRDPAGLTPLLETRVIEATELIAQRNASEAELAVTNALIELNQLRGLDPDAPLSVATSTPTFHPILALDSLLAAARTNNFDLRLRTSELEQQGFRVELARNERYPSFTVGPTFSEENGSDRQRIVGLAVSVPLPLWNNKRADVDIAKARQAQAGASLTAAQRELDRQVATAARTYESKLAALARWRGDAITHFREAAETADRNYRLSAVPVSTYVELQRQYVDAVNALLATRREALEAAAQLETLTGLPEPLIGWEANPKQP